MLRASLMSALLVVPSDAPKILGVVTSYTWEGNPANISCEVEAHPGASVLWFRDGLQLPHANSSNVKIHSSPALSLLEVSSSAFFFFFFTHLQALKVAEASVLQNERLPLRLVQPWGARHNNALLHNRSILGECTTNGLQRGKPGARLQTRNCLKVIGFLHVSCSFLSVRSHQTPRVTLAATTAQPQTRWAPSPRSSCSSKQVGSLS